MERAVRLTEVVRGGRESEVRMAASWGKHGLYFPPRKGVPMFHPHELIALERMIERTREFGRSPCTAPESGSLRKAFTPLTRDLASTKLKVKYGTAKMGG